MLFIKADQKKRNLSSQNRNSIDRKWRNLGLQPGIQQLGLQIHGWHQDLIEYCIYSESPSRNCCSNIKFYFKKKSRVCEIALNELYIMFSKNNAEGIVAVFDIPSVSYDFLEWSLSFCRVIQVLLWGLAVYSFCTAFKAISLRHLPQCQVTA